MATENASGLSSHLRGVTVTTIACLGGVVAALASTFVFGTDPSVATRPEPFAILAGVLFAQYPLFRLLGVDIADFGLKDNLYVAFMTFTFWFISLGVVLSASL